MVFIFWVAVSIDGTPIGAAMFSFERGDGCVIMPRPLIDLRKERLWLYLVDDVVDMEAGPFAVDVSRQSPVCGCKLAGRNGDTIKGHSRTTLFVESVLSVVIISDGSLDRQEEPLLLTLLLRLLDTSCVFLDTLYTTP